MKFAKYQEDRLVPEWRIKYLDYKIGKKKLKAVGRAIRNAEAASDVTISSSPGTFTNIANRVRRASVTRSSSSRTASEPAEIQGTPSTRGKSPNLVPPKSTSPSTRTPKSPGTVKLNSKLLQIGEDPDEESEHDASKLKVSDDDKARSDERQPIRSPSHSPRIYGTMKSDELATTQKQGPPSLILPAPAQAIDSRNSLNLTRSITLDASDLTTYGEQGPSLRHSEADTASAHEAQQELADHDTPASSIRRPQPLLRRVYSNLLHKKKSSQPDINRSAATYLEMTEDSQRDFFTWLDSELKKIDDFYNEKEVEARERFLILEHQIGLMDEYRSHEKEEAAREKARIQMRFGWRNPAGLVNEVWHGNGIGGFLNNGKDQKGAATGAGYTHMPTVARLGALAAETAAAPSKTGSNDGRRDYDRKPKEHHVPYRQAKRKLKVAITEYYHGLELLKSYCLLNREGFRKILKKFDKTAHMKIGSKYISEKVNPAAFSDSEEVDRLIEKTEQMFAVYYEKGRRKHAIERLRTQEHKRSNYGAMFRNGIYVGAGLPLFVQSLVLALEEPHRDHYGMTHPQEISYLLQIWAGFGFPVLLTMLFTLCCRAWALARINYVFVFEFDTRHNLDWHQLLEIPSLFMFVQSILMYFCFSNFWGDSLDRIWFPVIHLIVVLVLLFNPLPVFYLQSRKWFLYSLYRLFWAGLFPVEFRDFFMGDIFCSLTYSMGNISLFFCLYAGDWNDASMCNSSHSRLLGFFSALPGVWRLLQCLRRYRDTKQWFPHLANGGKYMFTILFYMSLSMYRIDRHDSLKAFFIFCATVNGLYTSTWDILMDWSLLDWYAPHKLLRNELAFKHASVYYLAMVIDPIIRFNWIFYAIFAQELQHSAALSFFVSLSEIFRRWMWAFFRMENEHCTNVGRFRAYRDDIPLPYNVPCPGISPRISIQGSPNTATSVTRTPSIPVQTSPNVNYQDPETQDPRNTPRIRAFSWATNAHAADFERRKPVAHDLLKSGRLHRAFSTASGIQLGDEDDEEDVSSSEDDNPNMHDRERALVDDRAQDMAGLRRRRDSRPEHSDRPTGTGLVVEGESLRRPHGRSSAASPNTKPNQN